MPPSESEDDMFDDMEDEGDGEDERDMEEENIVDSVPPDDATTEPDPDDVGPL